MKDIIVTKFTQPNVCSVRLHHSSESITKREQLIPKLTNQYDVYCLFTVNQFKYISIQRWERLFQKSIGISRGNDDPLHNTPGNQATIINSIVIDNLNQFRSKQNI